MRENYQDSLVNKENKTIHPETVFINISGFFNLIHGSKQPFAKKIKSWLDNEVIPALINRGYYYMQPKEIKIVAFFDNINISNFDNESVVYIGYTGFHQNEHLFKYGAAIDCYKRDFVEHKKTFPQFEPVYVCICNDKETVKELFERDLESKGLNRTIKIKEKNHTELFTISRGLDVSFFVNLMKNIVIKKNNTNSMFINNMPHYRNSEIIRLMELEHELMEAKFKISDNFKLERETQIKLKELDRLTQLKLERETQIKLKELDRLTQLKLQEKQLEMKRLDLEIERVKKSKSKSLFK